MPRIFIGWPLPSESKQAIGSISGALRNELPPASWTRPESYHLTFAFLGRQEEETIERLARALDHHLGDVAAAQVRLSGSGFFPSSRRPRVAWVGLRPEEPIVRIARSVRAALRAESIEIDEKPFHPHLTIARLKSRWRHSEVERFFEAWTAVEGLPLLVESVTLFESRLDPEGAKHIERARIELT